MEDNNGRRVEGYREEPHVGAGHITSQQKVKLTGEVTKYKARLVAKGFLQGLDYNEVFAPVAKIETIRLVRLIITSTNVNSSFLNESLDEEVYVCQPFGFEVTGHENKVYKLKVLYGLKQVPQAWNRRIDCFLLQLDFNKCTTEYEVYVRAIAGDLMFVCMYVDDLLVTGSNTTNIDEFKRRIMMEFEMTDLGLLSYFLGWNLSLQVKRFHMLDCNPAQILVDCGIKLVKEGSDKSIDATLYK
ncbi:hypothetical protein CR513_27190, partial [Mucuna pruriens]